ncbi:MAG: hypothetical protein WCC36_15165 [Gammaproteobacteria bacterium]
MDNQGVIVSNDLLRIPKHPSPVTLWVHPEGQVHGSIFVREQSVNHAGPETPLEVLNQADPFLVVQRESPEELRFYNRSAIVRVDYLEQDPFELPGAVSLPCEVHMMDGSLVRGTIREPLAADRARLFDYLNRSEERFLSVHVADSGVCLVNKSYVIHVTAPAPAES